MTADSPWKLAPSRLEALRKAPGPIVIDGDARCRLLDVLEGMVGGDPYQEGQDVAEILEILS